MTDEHTQFQIAARGWCHEGWRGGFYPDDLPEDWRLAYYGNEFRAVVVPAAHWETVDSVEVERWLEDTPERFGFYLEVVDLATDWDRFERLLTPLFPRIKGVLLRPPAVDADLHLLLPALEGIAGRWPVSLVLPEGVEPSDAGNDLLAEWHVTLSWTIGQGEPSWHHGPLVVARAAGNLAYAPSYTPSVYTPSVYTPREWREIIERCLRAAEGRTLLVVLEGAPPDVEALRAAGMIGDLLAPAGTNEP